MNNALSACELIALLLQFNNTLILLQIF